MAHLSLPADLVVLGDIGEVSLVFERRQRQSWFAVIVVRRPSAGTARAWVEAHYEGVRWRSPVECTALVGRLRPSSR